MIFFMGGPQLGELEAGIVARLFGAVASVVSGGVLSVLGTIAVGATATPLRRFRMDDEIEARRDDHPVPAK
jgi:hypothetical protein